MSPPEMKWIFCAWTWPLFVTVQLLFWPSSGWWILEFSLVSLATAKQSLIPQKFQCSARPSPEQLKYVELHQALKCLISNICNIRFKPVVVKPNH